MDDFGGFYVSSKDRVFRAVVAACGSRASAEEAVAEAYARACARWSSVRHDPQPDRMGAADRAQRAAVGVAAAGPGGAGRRSRPCVPAGAELAEPGLRGLVAASPRRQREVVALRVPAVTATAGVWRGPDGPSPAVPTPSPSATESAWDQAFERACRDEWPASKPWLPLRFKALRLRRAPLAAIAGKAILKRGKEVELSIRDGFFAAWWPTDDPHEVPVDLAFT